MKKQKYAVILIGAAIIIFSFISMKLLSGFKSDPEKAPEKELVRYVKAEKVNYATLDGEIFASGRVVSKSEIALSAEVSGKTLSGEIPFKEGQNFWKGQLLLKIYDKEASLGLKANKSTFLNNLAGLLPDLKIDFPDSYDMWYKFFESINIEKDLPEMPEIQSTKEKVFLASKGILSSYYNIKSAESTLKKYNIYAPFTGSISAVNIEIGGIASMGTRLGTIINTRELELEVPLKLDDAQWINKGDKVKLTSQEETGSWNGIVVRKSGDIDIQTQSVSVFISIINNQKTPLLKGQYLTAHFNTLTVDNVMEIPRNAIFNTDEVYVVKDGLLLKEKINIVKYNQKTVFINGVDENEMIVIEPLVNASENTKVKVL